MNFLKQVYNKEKYLSFLREKFNFSGLLEVIKINNNDIKSFEQLGFVTVKDDKKLPVFEIYIKPNTKLERNRVALRKMVAQKVGTADGAIAVFVDEDNEQWRFSFIAIEYEFGEKGFEKKQTASKRYTYLFGKGAKTRTAQQRFELLNKHSTLEDLKTAFAVEGLSQEFYQKLFIWYEKAQEKVTFPNDENDNHHTQSSLIRLLTRILFVWFLKEKDLINKDLFELEKLKKLIVYEKNSSFYKAILQNLFFATLNRQITAEEKNNRSFRRTTNGKANNTNYLATNIYRYQDYFIDKDEQKIMALFEQTPFLNGGLFECLDREASDEEKQQYDKDKAIRPVKSAIRIDGFSDNPKNELQFSNDLFFNNDEKNLGLIDLFNQYQFTVEESTSTDIDVALDPELLGKVFENLLATYNPETGEQARKATGSFYTPREIVSYMVDESLKQHFKTHTDLTKSRIDTLFVEGENPFNKQEIKSVIIAIDNLKILDPAVGSGAYPMGILQRLVFILDKIDFENEHFKQQQLTKAELITDEVSKNATVDAIKQIFSEANKYNAYGKKLMLIENCIYGVDIQPIAIQICKLRFFISLTIEQTADKDKENYGIKALPNLETKFIVANTLLPLGKIETPKEETIGLFDGNITVLQKELAETRHSYFTAKTLKTKRKYRNKDKDIREQMLQTLKPTGISPEIEQSMKKVVHWDLYNQNAVSDWFDPEWMFGIKNGFDIVIGNPPYMRVQGIERKVSKEYKSIFQSSTGSYDLYVLFTEIGLNLLSKKGVLNYIMPHKWVNSDFGKGLREVSKNNIYKLISFDAYQVFNASTYTSLVWFNKMQCSKLNYTQLTKNLTTNLELECYLKSLSDDDFSKIENQKLSDDSWILTNRQTHNILEKISQQPLKVSDVFAKIFQGIATSKDSVYFLTDVVEKNELLECYSKELNKRILIEKGLVKPLLKGCDVHRYETLNADKVVIFPYYILNENNKDQAVLYSEADIKNKFPNGYIYLKECETVLRNREKGKLKNDDHWFKYIYPKNLILFNKEKITQPDISLGGNFAHDKNGEFYQTTTLYGYIKYPEIKESYRFYMSIFNSQLLWWYLKQTGTILANGYFRFKPRYVETFPLPKLTHLKDTTPFEKLTDTIIKGKQNGKDTTALETKIDTMVYQLYDLTADEIKIIEDKD
ncbi:Eco57I restriction-modification methylase domain-containing protein [bacterium endosymbiont of Bathymodiolus sp. 5 South]|uniref:Eco57I restriction-modification methylase domain-containing protein n=1 Tax=bacterium endosymbiont of Bathymodiolus sp. 5 South TaxID=1181670 RepID=UPI0010B6CABB|nr:Eco57I restriction-modification methylase domain-containing protein [bacterium endosymbiont of Bathymodiolus sp. 5 South]SHN92489.1 Putative type IIS restriction /modification enzyme, N-terminal half [bacterium endosymbiont of Bathymodiolus sp. 5 South]VVH61650.1 Putative type IIS restriction /modification enzyme, N-terminal half [uncultured Gammaproteobacteria bacterium]VVM19165.1 Putative type IIS restriction /modification enzyme, N-terminal half [uncultured Gammaproteobacteria bacterium]